MLRAPTPVSAQPATHTMTNDARSDTQSNRARGHDRPATTAPAVDEIQLKHLRANNSSHSKSERQMSKMLCGIRDEMQQ